MSLTVERALGTNQLQHMMSTTKCVTFANAGRHGTNDTQPQRPSQQKDRTSKKANCPKRSSSLTNTFSPRITRSLLTVRASLKNSFHRKSKNADSQETPASCLRSQAANRSRALYKDSIKGTLTRMAGLKAHPSGDDEDDDLISPCSFRHRALKTNLRADSSKTACTFRSLDTEAPALDEHSFMTHRLPITTETKKLVFIKQRRTNIVLIETTEGERIGSIDYSSQSKQGIRSLRDASGTVCAIIQKKVHNALLRDRSRSTFRVYGTKPCYSGQKPSRDEIAFGFYVWAEIKNSGSLGGKFVMKKKLCPTTTSSCSDDQHVAKPFGSFLSKAKGYNIFDSQEKQCVKMVSLNKKHSKGIMIAPKHDLCLMLAFCTVVDEMVENLLM